VDRFLGLVIHVIQHTAQSRSLSVQPSDVEDLAHDVFLTILKDDLAVLRYFRGESSLAAYLTVVARRVVVRELLRRQAAVSLQELEDAGYGSAADDSFEQRITDRDEVQRLLAQLGEPESEVVRRYHLDGQSYREISRAMGIAENSIGPTLSRARAKLRAAADRVQDRT